MEQIIQSLLNMDPNTISSYINYFFLLIVVVGLIGFLVGFLKGLYKEASTFIVTALYFTLLILIGKVISQAIYEVDISSMVALPEGVKTSGDYLNHYFIEICETNGITIGNSKEMMNSIIAISLAFINLIVYLVLLIVGIIVIFVLDMLIYLILVRLIVPKHVRKTKKRRPIGGILGFVRYIVAFSLLLSPFTAMVNSTIGNLRDEDGVIQRNELDNDFYNALMNVLEGYNNSAVAKAFFIIEDKDGKSIDVKLMDYITNSYINEDKVISLYTEIGNFGALAVDALGTGFITSTSSIDYSLLLGAEFVGNAVGTVAKSTLIQTLLSVGVTLVVNMDSLKEQVDLSSIDFMNLDWESSLTAVSSAYTELYNCGLIDKVIEDPNKFMDEFYFDGEYSTGIKKAFKELGNNDLVCKVMPALIVSFASKIIDEDETSEVKRSDKNYKFLETLANPDTYKDIKWGDELANIYEVFENLSRQYYAFDSQRLTLSSLNELDTDVLLNSLFGTGIDFSLESDTSYEQQYERNVFVNGGIYNEKVVPGIKEIIGVKSESTSGLLNLGIINTMFEKEIFNDFIRVLDLNKMIDITEEELDLGAHVTDVIGDWDKSKWQNEFSAIVDVVAPIMNLVDIILGDDATVSEAKRAADTSNIRMENIIGDDSLDCLKRVTDVLGESEIFSEILPDIAEVVTNKQDDELISGLAISDLNFTYFEDEGTMVSELRDFVDDIDSINNELIDLLDKVASDDAIESLVDDCALGTDSVLGAILKIIKDNQIFNKHLTVEEKEDGLHRTFTNVMVGLLAEPIDSDNDLNVYSLTDGKIVIERDTIIAFDDNDEGWDDEIDGLVGFIGSLKGETEDDQIILDYISGNTDDDFDLGEEIFSAGDEIERIFASVDNSEILKEAFPDTFDTLIGDTFSDIIGGSPDFYNITSWADEGKYFNQLLTNIDSLRENGQELTSIDWLNVEEEKLANILTSLYKTQCVGGTYNEATRTNGVFHTILKDIMSQALENLEIKIEGEDVPEEDIIARDFDIDNNEKVVYKIDGTNVVYVSWLGDEESGYIGEINYIAKMVKSVSTLENDATIKEMETVLEKVNDCYVLRSTLGLIIESKTEEFDTNGEELMKEFVDRADFEVFHKDQLSLTPYEIIDGEVVEDPSISKLETRQEEVELRKEELNTIVDILNDADDISNKINQGEDGAEFDEITGLLENNTVDPACTKEQSDLEVILKNMHDSIIFNSKRYNDLGQRDFTSFEYFFNHILSDEAFVVDGVPLILAPTIEDVAYISEDTSSGLEDGWVNSETIIGEITNFNNSLYEVVNNPLVDVKLDESLSFIEAVQGTMAEKDENGVSIKVDGELVRDPSKSPVVDLLTDLQSSRLLSKSNAHVLDSHILNYLLDAIGYEEGSEEADHEVERKVYENVVLQYDETTLKEYLIDAGILEENLYENIKYNLWEHDGKAIEDLIFAFSSDLEDFDINKFDSEYIDELVSPMERSIGLNYLSTDDALYDQDVRSIYHLVVIKLVNTSIDAFNDTLGLYTNNVNDNLIENYNDEVEISKDLIDAYKEMDKEGKFNNGSITFTNNSTENKAFMDLVVNVLDPLYRSKVYHNVNSVGGYDTRISKDNSSTDKKQLSNLTLFEQVVYTMLNSSEQLINELYYDDGGITYSEVVEDGNDVINLRIREVTKLDVDSSSGLKWIILDSTNKIEYDCEIGKIHDMAGDNLEDTLDPENLDLTTIVKDNLDPNANDKLLNIINASYVLHDIVPHVIARYVSTHSAEDSSSSGTIAVDDLIFLNQETQGMDCSSIRGYAGEKIDSYLIEHEYDSFFTKVEHWNNDLYYISQLTLLIDEIEQNSTISGLPGGTTLTDVFKPLLYNLSMTETYKDAVPQITISLLNEQIKVDLGAIEPSLGYFIDGSNSKEKLQTAYAKIDTLRSITDNRTTYEPSYWQEEGEGIDKFISYLQSRSSDDIPDSSKYALGYHMYESFTNYLSTL